MKTFKKTLTKEAKTLLCEALFNRYYQADTTVQQEKLLQSLILMLGQGNDTYVQWITDSKDGIVLDRKAKGAK
tara:strand:+ start:41 stop:259 length:219 start_codon:yes stop_codon:yes gene_type:complete